MKDLSMHVMDIIQNSIVANATVIQIDIVEDKVDDSLVISIKDNGKGMDAEMVKNVTDPYCTSRTTRKVGLGIPLLKQSAELTGGSLTIQSEIGKGTSLNAYFVNSSIDRQPLGDIAGTIVLTVSANPAIDFIYTHTINKRSYCFDTREVKAVLGDVPVSNLEIIKYLREMIQENLKEIENKL
jgi:hypothetical protein